MINCSVCKQEKEPFARIEVIVGKEFKAADCCRECFNNTFKQTTVKMMLSALPNDWRELLNAR